MKDNVQALFEGKLSDCQKMVNQNSAQISSIKDQNTQRETEIDHHINNVEAELASDIETLKLNIESQLAEKNENMTQMREQLDQIQTERSLEKEKNRSELSKLFEDLTQLKTQFRNTHQKSERTNKPPSHQQYTAHSQNDTATAPNNQFSQSYRARAKERVERLKNVVVDGLYESPTKDLKHVVIHMCQDINTVDSALSGLCLKRTSVLSGQILWYRQNVSLFQYKTLCVKRTSVLCGQQTLFLKFW